MRRFRTALLGGSLVCATLGLLAAPGFSRAQDKEAALKAEIQRQKKELEELKKRLDAMDAHAAAQGGAEESGGPNLDPTAVKKIVSDYLKENPGAGMPPSVQTGFETGRGFVIRSAPNPKYVKWDDDCKIPFELRIRGRIQLDYYYYQPTDNLNHQTGAHYAPEAGTFSQLEVKRLRLIFEGTAFTPDLRYHFQLDGNTRGLGGFQNNRIVQTSGVPPGGGGTAAPGIGTAANAIGGGVTIDHAVRLFSAYVAYDWHPCWGEKGCAPDCPDGSYRYVPTVTAIAGKMKPLFGLEEYLGSANEQFVEFSMANWYFDAEDDNLMMAAGIQAKALDDRLFFSALITNGNESQFPNTQMDDYPGVNVGLWYDFGGSWNEERKKWDLFGDCLADVDYSCNPVVRIGGAANIVPMDRRSLFGDLEQSRVFVMPAGPGGTRLINQFNGDGLLLANGGAHAVDEFDSYSYNAFIAGKYRGFSISNEWWVRDLNNFQTSPRDQNNLIYTTQVNSPASAVADGRGLFRSKPLIDYGMQLQAGYFVVPKKLELVGRWAWIRGETGDINGNGRSTLVTIPTVPPPGTTLVRDVTDAFSHKHEANEYAIGVNYYFRRQLLKWQTDVSWYTGGNPAGGGQSPAGFIAGVDGWMLRTQLQLAF